MFCVTSSSRHFLAFAYSYVISETIGQICDPPHHPRKYNIITLSRMPTHHVHRWPTEPISTRLALRQGSVCLRMAKYTLYMCFMSTPLHESIAISDDTCYQVHRICPLLHKEVTMTGSPDERLIERWRQEYNQVRPHSALGYRPPAPETRMPVSITL